MGQEKVLLGTSAFTAAGWEGTFYPRGLPAKQQLTYYAQHFNTVEVDSTFYGTPSKTTVQGWAGRTPDGFIFAAKVPQLITHEKMLNDCDAEFTEFVEAMDCLGDKLGPLLFQFGYFNRQDFPGVNEFLARLAPFLKKLPKDHKFAVEIRNRSWLVPSFVDALREHGVALALVDQSWMPQASLWFEKFNPITADFTYVRWLGDRKAIEERTRIWNKMIVDRETELSAWVKVLEEVHRRKIRIYAFANNHYAGFGPGTIELFKKLWSRATGQEIGVTPHPKAVPETLKLFE